jgi:hypothetical protein
MLPASDLQDLPSPAQAACHASRAQFLQADWWHVRQRKDASADSRLLPDGSNLKILRKLCASQMIDLLRAFLTDVKNGNNLSKTKITGQTLRNYVKAATDCFSLLKDHP